MRILIIKTGALGDVLRTSVVLEGLAKKFTHPRIHWLTSKNAAALLENNPYIAKLYFKEQIEKDFLGNKYDLVISLEEDRKILEMLNKIKYRKLFGVYTDGQQIKYTPRSAMWYDMSLISRFGKKIADELKKANHFSYPELLYRMLNLPWKNQRYRLFLVKKDIKYANLLKQKLKDKPTVGIVVGAGDRWPMKSLPWDKQAEVAQKLKKAYGSKINILLLAGPSESGITQKIKNECKHVITHDPQELSEFMGIISLCDVLIAPDTLSLHLGIALNKYVVSYFTVTSANEIEIYAGKKIAAKHKDFCSYKTENCPRPNITDVISLNEIIESVKSAIKTR